METVKQEQEEGRMEGEREEELVAYKEDLTEQDLEERDMNDRSKGIQHSKNRRKEERKAKEKIERLHKRTSGGESIGETGRDL